MFYSIRPPAALYFAAVLYRTSNLQRIIHQSPVRHKVYQMLDPRWSMKPWPRHFIYPSPKLYRGWKCPKFAIDFPPQSHLNFRRFEMEQHNWNLKHNNLERRWSVCWNVRSTRLQDTGLIGAPENRPGEFDESPITQPRIGQFGWKLIGRRCQMILRKPRHSLDPLPVKSKWQTAHKLEIVADCEVLLKFGRLVYYGWASWQRRRLATSSGN